MQTFENRVAAITGAGSGIGRALALALARRKCHLALSDVSADGLAQTTRLARESGVRVCAHAVDVARREAVDAWAQEAAQLHGQVNLVFNNAGVALCASVESTSYADFERVMGINFWGVVHGTRSFLPHLRASGEGHVVNISSIFGLFGVASQSAYNASKFAVRGFSEALRLEMEMARAPVRVTCVHPGGVKTNILRCAPPAAGLAELGVDADTYLEKFERALRTTPDAAAQAILRGVQRQQFRVLVGPDARLADWLSRLMPGSRFAGTQFTEMTTPRLRRT